MVKEKYGSRFPDLNSCHKEDGEKSFFPATGEDMRQWVCTRAKQI